MEATNAMYLGKRHIVVILVTGLVLAAAMIWWRGAHLNQHSAPSTPAADGVNQYQVPSSDSSSLITVTSPEMSTQTSATEPAPAPVISDQQLQWNFSDVQKQEVHAWRISRGSVTIGSDPEYFSYSRETLRALAENSHDIKAMSVLGQLSGDEESLKWYRLAAVYGSSNALAGAAMAVFDNSPATPIELKKTRLIEALAYLNVAKLRNDFLAPRGIHLDVLESQAGVQLTDEDKAMAEQMAQPLYDELEAQRIQLGLGKFDNSVPPVVEAYYRMYNLK